MVQNQQILTKEVFSPQITKIRRERIIPLYKDATWSAHLIDKSSLSKNNNNFKFIYKFSPSGLSITNVVKIVLGEHRKPEKLWTDRVSEFYNKTIKSLLKEYETELYYTYSDLKTAFIERFNRTILHIINKPTYIKGDGNWVIIFKGAVVTYNNNVHSTINMTAVDASNNPDKVTYIISTSDMIKPKLKIGDYVRNADKRKIVSKDTLLIRIKNYLKLMKL